MAKRILVAEGSSAIRSVAETVLRPEGYEVFTAEDGPLALRLLKALLPDLLVADWELPGFDGLALYEQAREQFPQLTKRTLFLVRHPQLVPRDVTRYGVGILTKPFSPRDLLEAIDQLFRAAPTAAAPAPGGSGTTRTEAEPEQPDTDKLPPNRPAEPERGAFAPPAHRVALHPPIPEPEEEEVSLEALLAEGGVELEVAGSKKTAQASDPNAAESEDPTSKVAVVSPPGEPKARPLREPSREPAVSKKTPAQGWSMAGAVDLPDDLPKTSPPAYGAPGDDAEIPHDYDWFLAEMERSAKGEKPRPGGVKPHDDAPTDRAYLKRPAESVTSKTVRPEELKLKVEEVGTSRLGYERIVAEYRKELQKQAGEQRPGYGTAPPKAEGVKPVSTSTAPRTLAPPEGTALLPGDFTDKLITEIGRQVAKEIMGRLDEDNLRALVKKQLANLSAALQKK